MDRSRKSNASSSGGDQPNKSGSSKGSGSAHSSNVTGGDLNKSKKTDSTTSSQCARDLGLDLVSPNESFGKTFYFMFGTVF